MSRQGEEEQEPPRITQAMNRIISPRCLAETLLARLGLHSRLGETSLGIRVRHMLT